MDATLATHAGGPPRAFRDRSDALRRHVLAATWLSYAGYYATRKVFSVVKGPMVRALQSDDIRVSHLWTIYLAAYALGMFVSAALAARVRCRTQLLLGMTLSIASNVACALLVPMGPAAYVPLLVCFGVHGVAQSTGWPNNVALVGRWTSRHERGSVMGAWCTCYQLGSVFAKALAAYSFAHVGLAGSFLVSSAVLGVITLFFLRYGHEDPADHGLSFADAREEGAHEVAVAERHTPPAAPIPAHVIVTCMGVLYFGVKFLRYALDSWTPRLLEESFALATSDAGYLSTAFDWVGFLGVLFAGFASDHLWKSRRLPVITFMCVGMALSCALMVTIGMTAIPVFAVLLGLVGFMAMGPDSLLSGVAAVDSGDPKQAARAVAIVQGLGSAGPIVQEPVVGYLKTAFGVGAVFALLAVFAVATALGAVVFLRVTRRRGLEL
jgi:sugar phosphate permease